MKTFALPLPVKIFLRTVRWPLAPSLPSPIRFLAILGEDRQTIGKYSKRLDRSAHGQEIELP